MITVKVKLIDGNIDIFTTDKYMVAPIRQMHPAILDVKVYADRKLLIHKRRPFQWFYKKFLYKPERVELKQVDTEVEHQKG
jgi:hypothetical protein